MRLHLFAAAVAVFLCGSLVSRADTLAFTYSGTDVTNTGGTSSGSGTISFNGTPSSLTLASLTDFTFSQTTTVSAIGTSSFTYSLGDLTSFSATLSGDELLTLMLHTGLAPSSDPALFFPESFTVTSLDPGGAETINPSNAILQVGQVTQTNAAVTPEPSSFLLLATGLAGAAGVVRRRLA